MDQYILTYALNAENNLVYIDDVLNGLECSCFCPKCREPLIAKNGGEVRAHHFAHKSGVDCPGCHETMIHLLAKYIFMKNCYLPFEVDGRQVQVSSVYAEVPFKDLNIIPDILGTFLAPVSYPWVGKITREIPFIVEFYVTHKVDDEKKKAIIKSGILAVEIDLSESTATTISELARDIYDPKNMSWLNKYVAGFDVRVNNS